MSISISLAFAPAPSITPAADVPAGAPPAQRRGHLRLVNELEPMFSTDEVALALTSIKDPNDVPPVLPSAPPDPPEDPPPPEPK